MKENHRMFCHSNTPNKKKWMIFDVLKTGARPVMEEDKHTNTPAPAE